MMIHLLYFSPRNKQLDNLQLVVLHSKIQWGSVKLIHLINHPLIMKKDTNICFSIWHFQFTFSLSNTMLFQISLAFFVVSTLSVGVDLDLFRRENGLFFFPMSSVLVFVSLSESTSLSMVSRRELITSACPKLKDV